jgi:hypothetical protein
VLSDVRGPAAVAIRPGASRETYEVFVAEVGAGRIVRTSSDKRADSREAVTGFVTSSDADDFDRLPGVRGLLFLDAGRLVAVGGEGDGRPFVRLYELIDPSKPLSAEQYEQQAAPAAADQKLDDNIVSFRNPLRTQANDKVPDSLMLTAVDQDLRATMWRLPVRGGTLGDLKTFGKDGGTSPLAIAAEPHGSIVVIRPAERDTSATSRMEFVNPIDGQTNFAVSINLANIVAVVYNPITGDEFVIRNTPGSSDSSGVFRIDAEESGDPAKPSATGKLMAKVQHPTAMAFGPDGVLYVSSLGADQKSGSLMKVSGL